MKTILKLGKLKSTQKMRNPHKKELIIEDYNILFHEKGIISERYGAIISVKMYNEHDTYESMYNSSVQWKRCKKTGYYKSIFQDEKNSKELSNIHVIVEL